VTSAGSIDIVLDHNAGALRRGEDPAHERTAALDLLPAVEELLEEAARLGVPVRLLAPEPLDGARLRELADAHPLVADARVLEEGAPAAAGGPHVIVAADRVVRQAAADKDCKAVAHPALALPTLLGQRFAFVRLGGDIDALRDAPGVVPYWVERTPDGDWAFALLTPAGLARALDAGLQIDRLALRHDVEDALLVQLDEGMRGGGARGL